MTALALVAVAPTAAFATSVIDECHVGAEIGSIVASPDGARLYVATTDHLSTTTQIDVIDASTGAVITQYPSPAFSAVPYDLAISADGTRLFAASYDTNNVFVFETGAGNVSGVFETGAGPIGLYKPRTAGSGSPCTARMRCRCSIPPFPTNRSPFRSVAGPPRRRSRCLRTAPCSTALTQATAR